MLDIFQHRLYFIILLLYYNISYLAYLRAYTLTDFFSFSKFASAALIGSVMTVSLLGCQPKTDGEPAASEDVTTVDSHAEHDHEVHDHESHNDMDVHEGHDYEGHDHSEHASNSTPFSCEPTATIGVYYHTDATPQTAHLLIDGIEYDLTATSGSDALTDKTIYTSDIGLDDTHGIIWQVDGDNATLLNKTLNSDVPIDEEEVIFDCHKS
jgi:hypothetical protein|tara:strand:+ start:19581 stop:20210 length:630 start_codon:yes stop_codon:yes gene_type:complete